MNQRSLAALILINAVLLAALVVTAVTPSSVQAQFGGNSTSYMMIAGAVRGRDNQNAVYIVDRQTSQMIALMFSSVSNRFEFLDARVISEDAGAGGGR